MEPYFYDDAAWEVETEYGVEIVPLHVCDSCEHAQIRQCIEGSEIVSIKKLAMGIVWRLSMPGYLDCSNWHYAPNITQAKSDYEDLYLE